MPIDASYLERNERGVGHSAEQSYRAKLDSAVQLTAMLDLAVVRTAGNRNRVNNRCRADGGHARHDEVDDAGPVGADFLVVVLKGQATGDVEVQCALLMPRVLQRSPRAQHEDLHGEDLAVAAPQHPGARDDSTGSIAQCSNRKLLSEVGGLEYSTGHGGD